MRAHINGLKKKSKKLLRMQRAVAISSSGTRRTKAAKSGINTYKLPRDNVTSYGSNYCESQSDRNIVDIISI